MDSMTVLPFIAGLIGGGVVVWFLLKSRLTSEYDRGVTLAATEQAFVKATLQSRDAEMTRLRATLEQRDGQLEELRRQSVALMGEMSSSKTRLEEERKSATEKIQLLDASRDRLKLEFENLANRIFEDKTQRFSVQSKESIDGLLKPLREQLGDFRRKVEDVYDKESKERTSLLDEVRNLKDLNQQVSRDAVNLTNALKGEVKTMGNWGEFVLEKTLELSGLKPGLHFDTQASSIDVDGRRKLPDVIVHLPGDGGQAKDIIVDSKVSLVAYERCCSLPEGSARQAALAAHLDSINGHIKELAAKDYAALPNMRTLDFVMLFIPIEGAFLMAVDQDRDLCNRALERSIVLVTPSTLIATLRIVASLWRIENQHRNAEEIAVKAGALYDKFVGFAGDMDGIGDGLRKATEAFDSGMNKLSTGKGNLVRKTEELRKLGAKTVKTLSAALLEKSELE